MHLCSNSKNPISFHVCQILSNLSYLLVFCWWSAQYSMHAGVVLNSFLRVVKRTVSGAAQCILSRSVHNDFFSRLSND